MSEALALAASGQVEGLVEGAAVGVADGHDEGVGSVLLGDSPDELNLTADQEAAWKTYTDTMMPPTSMMGDSSTDWDTLTTPQRADKMLEFSKQHEQHMEAHVAAMKTLYAALTPDQ